MQKRSRKETERLIKEAGKAVFSGEITRLMAEYGPVRIAKLVAGTEHQTDTLVALSPIFCVPGDVQLPAVVVLDTRLFNLGEAAYGSIRKAAGEFVSG